MVVFQPLTRSVEVAGVLAGQWGRFQRIAFALYLAQGLGPVVLYGRTIFGRLSRALLGFLFGSLLVYGVGAAFYLRPEMPWNHVVWHAAIVLGCLLNFGGVRQLLREPATSSTEEDRR